ncbi:MAG: GGDEF domain-containing protein [Gemmatimonadaceae bacterium]
MARTLDRGFGWMYFPPRLEQLFEHETQRERSAHLVAVGILWIALGTLYTILSTAPAGPPHSLGVDAAVRLGLVTPVLIAVTFAIWWGVPPVAREFLMMLVNVIAPASMILVVTFAQHGDVGANRGALTIVLLFITVVVRLRFWYAAAACVAIVFVQVGVPSLLHVPVPGNVPLALVTIVGTLTANYTLEREYRRNYLHRVHSRVQGARLAETIAQLHDLSQRDPLTGLANRRAMDSQLEELCSQNERFAVILVDIDAFKQFNDCYGHQIGDDCLRRVAAMLRASLRFTADRIARIGGEEFAVVLPQTALEDARMMAERMRTAVYGLAIPHVGSPIGDMVSISAGVSASTGPASPGKLIAEADKALYRAKANGRNRVEVATDLLDEAIVSASVEPVAV